MPSARRLARTPGHASVEGSIAALLAGAGLLLASCGSPAADNSTDAGETAKETVPANPAAGLLGAWVVDADGLRDEVGVLVDDMIEKQSGGDAQTAAMMGGMRDIMIDQVTGMLSGGRLNVAEDGTFTLTGVTGPDGEEPRSGSWTFDQGTMTLNASPLPDAAEPEEPLTAELEGDALIVSVTGPDGQLLVVPMVRPPAADAVAPSAE